MCMLYAIGGRVEVSGVKNAAPALVPPPLPFISLIRQAVCALLFLLWHGEMTVIIAHGWAEIARHDISI